jgi:hypothetical protein
MAVLRLLPMLLLATTAWAQVATPPTCRGVVLDREAFRDHRHRITLHVRYHEGANVFDSRYVVRLRRSGKPDPSCTDGDVVDFFIDQLVKQRRQLLP